MQQQQICDGCDFDSGHEESCQIWLDSCAADDRKWFTVGVEEPSVDPTENRQGERT